MRYTKIIGTPVTTGLYTLFLPVALFAVFGSSRHLVVSADSATAAMVAAALTSLSFMANTPRYIELTSLIGIVTAAILLLARILRLGFLADFLSRTVLVGFLVKRAATTSLASRFSFFSSGRSAFSPTLCSRQSFSLSVSNLLTIVAGGRFGVPNPTNSPSPLSPPPLWSSLASSKASSLPSFSRYSSTYAAATAPRLAWWFATLPITDASWIPSL